MRIKLSPLDQLPGQFVPLIASKTGDVLTLNGETFDFSQLREGDTLPAAAIESEWITGTVERIEGVLHLSLRLPQGPSPSQAVAFPEPIHVTEDGPIPLPFDPEPEPIPDIVEELPA